MLFVASKKSIKAAHPTLGKIEIAGEFPQAESLDDAVKFCGGEVATLEFINSAIEYNAKNTTRGFVRNSSETDGVEKIATGGADAMRNYAPSSERTRKGNYKERAQKLDAVTALVESGREFTREELLALLMGTK